MILLKMIHTMSKPFRDHLKKIFSRNRIKNWPKTCSLVCSFRWVKFEEDVEDGSNRWSKPHVATLSLHSLFELRNLLTKGTILLDMEASKYEINFIHLLGSFLILQSHYRTLWVFLLIFSLFSLVSQLEL